MINSTEKSKYPMKWRDTCASWSWCWKLSQQTGRDGFPRQASNRKRPLGDNALELPLWHKQPSKVRGKTFFYISFKEVFFKRTPRMVKSHPPFFLWRLFQRERSFVQLQGIQRDLVVIETGFPICLVKMKQVLMLIYLYKSTRNL